MNAFINLRIQKDWNIILNCIVVLTTLKLNQIKTFWIIGILSNNIINYNKI